MNMKLGLAALTMTLAMSVGGFATPASTKLKSTAAHKAAIKQCNADYRAAEKEARTKKGKERKEAETAARQARKQCIAAAPK
jgi:hypothetical protein